MGGKSSSSSSRSTSSTTTNTTNVSTNNLSAAGAEGITIVGSSGAEVHLTDGGAFDLVEDISSEAINAVSDNAGKIIENLIEFAGKETEATRDFRIKAENKSAEAIESVVKNTTFLVAAVFGIYFLTKAKT